MKIYTTLLLLFCLSCKKQTADPLSYTSKMAGSHTWVGTTHIVSSKIDTTYNYSISDTITVLNNKTLVILHYAFSRYTTSVDTLVYLKQLEDTLVFTSQYWDNHYTYDSENDTLRYVFPSNVILWNYEYYTFQSSGSSSVKIVHLHTP